MTTPSQVDKAGRQIAGLLTYNPGPGIYSRLERAIEAMPENVRVQELPGLLKRYKDGVPGWELKATDLDSVINGRDVVPREELLGAVRERSPVYTHKEMVFTESPPQETIGPPPWFAGEQYAGYVDPVSQPVYQKEASAIGGGIAHGRPQFQDYGHNGANYSELLLLQPGADAEAFKGHFRNRDGRIPAAAHARYDTHGDALRINELQSDLGIHNRKMREKAASPQELPYQRPNEPDWQYEERLQGEGYTVDWDDEGNLIAKAEAKPFPLEDAWADILVKRLALEAARQGHRAIEVASPRVIADKVGGNIDNYEHFYGKVVPGALERLGRKMGGLFEDVPQPRAPTYDSAADEILSRYNDPTDAASRLINATRDGLRRDAPAFALTPADTFENLARTMRAEGPAWQKEQAHKLYDSMLNDLVSRGADIDVAVQRAAGTMPQLMRLAEEQAQTAKAYRNVRALAADRALPVEGTPDTRPRRYILSDEMRRRLIQQGVGAAVAVGVLSQDDLIERLNQ
jgi:hypothetical protein